MAGGAPRGAILLPTKPNLQHRSSHFWPKVTAIRRHLPRRRRRRQRCRRSIIAERLPRNVEKPARSTPFICRAASVLQLLLKFTDGDRCFSRKNDEAIFANLSVLAPARSLYVRAWEASSIHSNLVITGKLMRTRSTGYNKLQNFIASATPPHGPIIRYVFFKIALKLRFCYNRYTF